MDRLCENYPDMYLGLLAAKKEFDTVNPSFKPKIIYAQKLFFERNNIYDSEYIQRCDELLELVLYRDAAAYFTLEFFHSIRNTKDYCSAYIADIKIDRDNDMFLHQVLLDQYLLLAYASLEYYLNYIYYFCLRKEPKHKGLRKILNELERSESERVIMTYQYIVTQICNPFDEKSTLWGDKLRDLRNRTAHEKNVQIGTIQRENLLKITREEPALEGQQIAHYLEHQFVAKKVLMFEKMNLLLYGIPWVPGPFHERIYDEKL
ncbi:MAG TPA: hypothetical protein PK791_02515 [Anaerolineaceae bacterium]|nr:hypothetical protein [Anaerolineaceae bacterium]HNZ14997.1 hypothetical protein [Anaerolineaceae bacterium]HOH92219.1 hypothetical protein [Anaerolineaceae bacterium]